MLDLQLTENLDIPKERLRMKFLHLEYFPWLETLPEWIEGAAETLQTLIIINFPRLEMLPECLTRMTHLKMLHIANCPQLFYLPSGMQCLTALEALTIDGCPELCRKCQPQSGVYWPMIAHIKHVSIGEPRGEEPQEGPLVDYVDELINLEKVEHEGTPAEETA